MGGNIQPVFMKAWDRRIGFLAHMRKIRRKGGLSNKLPATTKESRRKDKEIWKILFRYLPIFSIHFSICLPFYPAYVCIRL